MLNNLLSLSSESPADYAKISRKISNNNDLREINVAFLSSYTMDILKPYVHVELAKRGLFSSTYFAPYNNIEQEIIDDNSGLYAFNPDVVVIHNRIEDVSQNIFTKFYSYSDSELENDIASIILRFKDMLETLRKNSNTRIIIMNFVYTQDQLSGFLGSPLSNSILMYIQNINNQLWQLCSKISSCYIMNYQQLLLEYGLYNWFDSKLYFLYRIPFNANAQIRMGKTIARNIAATFDTPCKCLVLDLDNTLWGGILGEDGISGIQIGDDYPGNVYKKFQSTVLSLRDQGILLAVASKNDVIDAMEVIEKHTGCLIKKKHLSSVQINWSDKATNLKKIAEELNIGIDTIAFFDDNPVEREWVKSQIPEVKVIDVPKNPMLYSRALLDSELFDKVNFTEEDKTRADKYNHEKKRAKFHAKSKSVTDFLKNIEMSATLGFVGDITLSRVGQLVNKTNQFNLTCVRHTVENIKEIISDDGVVIWLSVKDKFGDSGIIGVAIAKKLGDNKWLVDTFLLSCRVIGRQLDSVLLSYLCTIVKNKGGIILYGEYIPTARNSLVNDFFIKKNFKKVNNKENYWSYDLRKESMPSPTFIKAEFIE